MDNDEATSERRYLQERRAHVARTVTFLLLGALAIGYGLMARTLGLTRSGLPAAGLWPFLIGLGLLASAGAAYLSERLSAPESVPSTQRRKEVVAFGSLALFVLAFDLTGLVVPLLLLLVVWVRYLAGESVLMTVIVSTVGTAAIYLLFVEVLGVPVRAVSI